MAIASGYPINSQEKTGLSYMSSELKSQGLCTSIYKTTIITLNLSKWQPSINFEYKYQSYLRFLPFIPPRQIGHSFSAHFEMSDWPRMYPILNQITDEEILNTPITDVSKFVNTDLKDKTIEELFNKWENNQLEISQLCSEEKYIPTMEKIVHLAFNLLKALKERKNKMEMAMKQPHENTVEMQKVYDEADAQWKDIVKSTVGSMFCRFTRSFDSRLNVIILNDVKKRLLKAEELYSKLKGLFNEAQHNLSVAKLKEIAEYFQNNDYFNFYFRS